MALAECSSCHAEWDETVPVIQGVFKANGHKGLGNCPLCYEKGWINFAHKNDLPWPTPGQIPLNATCQCNRCKAKWY